MSPASPRRSSTPTIRRVPGNFEVARFLAAMAPRLVSRAATSSAGRSGCAVVIGAAQPTDQSSVAASIARAADRGFVAVLSRHRYRCESPHHRPTPRRHDERGLPASRWFRALRRHARLAPNGGGTARFGILGRVGGRPAPSAPMPTAGGQEAAARGARQTPTASPPALDFGGGSASNRARAWNRLKQRALMVCAQKVAAAC